MRGIVLIVRISVLGIWKWRSRTKNERIKRKQFEIFLPFSSLCNDNHFSNPNLSGGRNLLMHIVGDS